eukprot:g1298.t1
MRRFMVRCALVVSLIISIVKGGKDATTKKKKEKKPNVVVIVVDDLRPMFDAFGYPHVKAPNMNGLAKDGFTFNFTFCQQPVCGPSRNSFMTGRYPDQTRTWNFKTNFRKSGLDKFGKAGVTWTTLPELFKKSGYNTLGLGKLFHPGSPPENDCPRPRSGDCPSWSTTLQSDKNITMTGGESGTSVLVCPPSSSSSPFPSETKEDDEKVGRSCNATSMNIDSQIMACNGKKNVSGQEIEWDPSSCDRDEDDCTDRWLADAAIESLDVLSRDADDANRPFLAMFGFHKPHPFWSIPSQFPGAYESSLPLPYAKTAPKNMPNVSYFSCFSLNGRSDVGGPNCELNENGCEYVSPSDPLAESTMRRVRAAYAGGVTWVDSQIGRVLRKLDEIGRADDTAVLLFADHGWALGEHGFFCKQALLELQTRVPMILRVPWIDSATTSTKALVELVDVLPTLADLAGIPLPANESFEGESLLDLLRQKNDTWWVKDARFDASFMQYPRCLNSTDAQTIPPYMGNEDACTGQPSNEFTHMGYCVRTALWRYCEWPEWGCEVLDNCEATSPKWDTVRDNVELYDHSGDDGSCFDCFERVNLASDASYAGVVEALSKRIRRQYPGPQVISPTRPR